MGGFNFKEIDWVNQATTISEDHMSSLFLENVRDNFLNYFFQKVTECTRLGENNLPSLLDLIFLNEENMISNVQFLPGIGKSDHIVILFDFNCFIQPELDVAFNKLNFFKGDYLSISSEFTNIDWSSELNELDLNLSWSFFVEKTVKLLEKYIPENKVCVDRVRNNPYMTKACKEAVHRKHTKWLKYQYCKTDLNYDAYKVARNEATLQLRKSKYSYEKDLTTRIKTENKLFWSYVRNNTKTKSSVGKLMKPPREECKSNQETANVLN